MAEKKKTGNKKFSRNNNQDDRKDMRNFRKPRKKICSFCFEKVDEIDYKNVEKLKKYISDKGKILPRRVTGNCARHQRKVTEAVRRARHIALLPYTVD